MFLFVCLSAQKSLDDLLIKLDGTPNKTNLGANSILGVSLAVAKAGADAKGVPLYQHFAALAGNDHLDGSFTLPMPCFNVINGGSHAGNKLAFQVGKSSKCTPSVACVFGLNVRICALTLMPCCRSTLSFRPGRRRSARPWRWEPSVTTTLRYLAEVEIYPKINNGTPTLDAKSFRWSARQC